MQLRAGLELTHVVGQRNALGEAQASEGAATDKSLDDADKPQAAAAAAAATAAATAATETVAVAANEQSVAAPEAVGDSIAWVVSPGDRLLAAGALVVADIRAAVLRECGYTSKGSVTCAALLAILTLATYYFFKKNAVSAGISHNRMLAKLTSGMNKPYAQTLIPMSRVPAFFAKLPVSKVK